MPIFTVEILRGFNESALRDILIIEKACFPVEWHYPDADKYYTTILRDDRNIIILLKDGQKAVGYILSVPHNVVRAELFQYDFQMKTDNARYYIESIGISPQYRRRGGGTMLINTLCDEAKKRGICKFSIHSRTSNRLNILIKRLFKGMITETRHIQRWFFGGNEPYEYIEWTYNKQ